MMEKMIKDRTEVKFKRPEGTIKIKVCVEKGDYYNREIRYVSRIEFCEKGKRTWRDVPSHVKATKEEIHKAKLKLWESLKPQKEDKQ